MASEARSHKEVIEVARKAFDSRRTIPIEFRLQQLKHLLRFFEENAEGILDTLKKDMRKSKNEALLFEVNYLKTDIKKMMERLQEFMANEDMPLNLISPLDHAYIQNEPLGVVLIIGTWNYPFMLLLQPLVGAIAAGNSAILKPSELVPSVAEFLFQTIPRYLDNECYQVVLAGPEETKDLLTNRFDHIFFTGSPSVGRSVYSAAAVHLTPCTLELGGKSPCYIDESANFKIAAKRILWGKFVNFGQTCIAPDYILCSKKAEQEFIKTAKSVLTEWYGEKPQENPDLPRIVNSRHFNRIKKIIDTTTGLINYILADTGKIATMNCYTLGRIAIGGKMDANDLWIDPTIIVDVNEDDAVMEEEIFGPVLPILTVNSVDEAIKFILARPKPLAMYTFSINEKENEKILSHISSGGACVNDCLWQNAWEGLPLGGVGNSGFGRYHGKFSFDTFSHKKAVLHRGFSYVSEKLGEARYPPYTDGKLRIFDLILSNFHRFLVPSELIQKLIWAFCGALAAYLYVYFFEK